MAEIINAFTTETAMRLTGLSTRRLAYWDKTGFFSPSRRNSEHPLPYSRIYSFQDIVGLRTIAILRERGVSLQELRKVGEWLALHMDEPWSSLRFYLRGNQVFFRRPESDEVITASAPAGQKAIVIELETVANDVKSRLTMRRPDQIGKLDRRRSVLNNSWVIAGTRIPTSTVRELSEAGYSTVQIIEEYPQLKPADITTALAHEITENQLQDAS